MNNTQNVQDVHVAVLGSKIVSSVTGFASDVLSGAAAPVPALLRILSTALSMHGVFSFALTRMHVDEESPNSANASSALYNTTYASIQALSDQLPASSFRSCIISAVVKLNPSLSADKVGEIFDSLDDGFDHYELVDYLFSVVDDFIENDLSNTINLIYDEQNPVRSEEFLADLFELASEALYQAANCCTTRAAHTRAYSNFERQLRLLS